MPYEPTIEVDPGQPATDSPSGAVTKVDLPFIEGGDSRQSAHTRRAELTLPQGMGLNPAGAQGLVACTDAEFGKGTKNPIACPPASEVGTVTVETPPLPEGSLTGKAYIGQQLSRDPASGEAYRLFVAASSERFGISARLLGKVFADPQTGRLRTVFDDPPLGKAPLPGRMPALSRGTEPVAAATSAGVAGASPRPVRKSAGQIDP